MKHYLLLFVLFALNAVAQTPEPNLKWGKPTDEELRKLAPVLNTTYEYLKNGKEA